MLDWRRQLTSTTGAGGVRGRRRKDAAKSAEFITTDDEAGEASEVEGVVANGKTVQNGALSDGEGGPTEDEQDAPAAPVTPKARPKPRATRKQREPSKSPSRSPSRMSRSPSQLSSLRESEPPEVEVEADEVEAEEAEPAETPKASRKRARSDEDDEEEPSATTNGAEEEEDSPGAEGEDGPEASQESEIKIRRKRARR